MGQSRLRIGQFAQVGQISIATLRHYDELGLLKPALLDPDTRYRYYTIDQLPLLNRIVVLKDLGFSLPDIARQLQAGLAVDQLRSLYTTQQARIARVIATEQARLIHIAIRLRHIEEKLQMTDFDIRLKTVEPVLIGSVRARVPLVHQRKPLESTLESYFRSSGLPLSTPDYLILHSHHEKVGDEISIDLEVARPFPKTHIPMAPGSTDRGLDPNGRYEVEVAKEVPQGTGESDQVQVRTLPGGLVASTVHTGDPEFLGPVYAALFQWMNDNAYRFVSEPRQIFLHRSAESDANVIEVQFPVEKTPA